VSPSYFASAAQFYCLPNDPAAPPFKPASNPEYRLCGRSLRTAMLNAFLCPTST
jgi:hypothetical protein